MAFDLRASTLETYAMYRAVTFKTFIGTNGDSYDRFLIRSRELFESMLIVCSALEQLVYGSAKNVDRAALSTLNNLSRDYKNKMESLICKFKNIQEPAAVTSSIVYCGVEAGKGEFGVYLATNLTQKPYRVYLRSPAFNHLQLINLLGSGLRFADVVTLVGTLDLVFGEVDR